MVGGNGRGMQMRRFRGLAVVLASALAVMGGATAASAERGATYTVQLDAQPPAGEPLAFLRLFPHAIAVHRGDVIDAAWGGIDTPHTASFVNTTDPDQWRADNQCQGCPYAPFVPDSAVGGDDNELVFNPAVAVPSSFGCGDPGTPCVFDGTAVTNSGVNFPNPASQPSFFVRVGAPVGQYTILCLLHEGMQIPLRVEAPAVPIPSPAEVTARGQHEAQKAANTDGHVADAEAQQVQSQGIGGGRVLWTINAGGFSNNVTANEYVESGLQVRVGDRIEVDGNNEIHTATFPAEAINRVPFTISQCEVPGPDTPANSPADCQDPQQFQVALNNDAILPSDSNRLVRPNRFVNSGLLPAEGTSYTFVAKAAGTYSLICLVHGPEMSTTVTVVAG